MKLKTIKLTFLLLFFSFNLLKADMTKDAFLDVGINSIREWSSCATNNDIPTAKYEEYEQVINDGWRHINIILCAHNDFPNDKLSTKGFDIRIMNLRIQIEALLKKYPDIAFGISFKGYKPVGGTGKYGWDVKGIPQAILYKRIEDSPELQKEYLKWWRLVANEFKKIDRVAFTIMNEPEWHKISKGKKKWRKLSLEAIDAIREISPNRWIILEGINKSLIARDWTARGVMGKPVDRDKIIYGFHYYLTTNAGPESENNPKVVVKKINKSEYSNGWKALKSVIKYSEQYNVPVSVTEFGMTGLLEGKGGVDLNLRTDFVKKTIVKYMDACNECGLTWWALGDYNTPYVRQSPNKYQNFPRVPDQDLFEILKLKKKNNSNFSSKQGSPLYLKRSTKIIGSALFDGRYSFSISRYNENEGSKTLGNGYIKIQNGIMTVERENRTLLGGLSGSVDLYDTFEGKIDKKGNIISSLTISALLNTAPSDLENVNLLGNIDELLKGPWDHYFDIIVKLEKK